MGAVELHEFVQDVVAVLAAGMGKQLAAGDRGKEQAAEVLGDLDANPALVFALGTPALGLGGEVVIAGDEIVGGLDQGGAQAFVGAARQGTVGAIDPVALVTGGHQAGAAGDGVGMGVVADGAQFAGEVGDTDDVEAGDYQEQHVGGAGQVLGGAAFQPGNLLVFGEAIVVQSNQELQEQIVLRRGGRGRLGPGEDFGEGGTRGRELMPGQQSQQAGALAVTQPLGRAADAGQGQGQGALPG